MSSQGQLKRTLRLPDLIIMGLILVQPTAPMPLFGVVFEKASGHVVTAILVAMVGMMCTAWSYGRMSRHFSPWRRCRTWAGSRR